MVLSKQDHKLAQKHGLKNFSKNERNQLKGDIISALITAIILTAAIIGSHPVII